MKCDALKERQTLNNYCGIYYDSPMLVVLPSKSKARKTPALQHHSIPVNKYWVYVKVVEKHNGN